MHVAYYFKAYNFKFCDREARSYSIKIDMLDSVTYLNRTPIFEWYMVRFGSKDGHQKDICLKEIGLRAQTIITVLGSVVNLLGGTYMTIERARESSLWYWIRYSYELQKLRGKWLRPWFGFSNHLVLIVCFKSSKVLF